MSFSTVKFNLIFSLYVKLGTTFTKQDDFDYVIKEKNLCCVKNYTCYSPRHGGGQCALSVLDLAAQPLPTFSPRHLPKYRVAGTSVIAMD